MLHFATYLDSNYLVRFLPMYWSLKRHCDMPFQLHVLCLDEKAYVVFQQLQLSHVHTYELDALLRHDQELASVRATRTKVEFYFTCTAAWVLYLFDLHPSVERLTYLDADLFFFASPEILFEGMEENTILVSEHRFSAAYEDFMVGMYNVAFLSFPRKAQGRACLSRWRQQCIDWCYDRCEDGKYADQKYLDEWPRLYSDFKALTHPGADVAPWNISGAEVEKRGDVYINGERLIFYHFEHFNLYSSNLVDSGLSLISEVIDSRVAKFIHVPYVTSYIRARKVLSRKIKQKGNLEGETRHYAGKQKEHLGRLLSVRLMFEGRAIGVMGNQVFYFGGSFGRICIHMFYKFKNLIRLFCV